MGSKVPPNRVWKRTPRMITHELVDEAVKEIEGLTSWTRESIRRKLFVHKDLIQVPGASYHIYRDSLG